MTCKHCNGKVEHQHDRIKCLICGRSEWHLFAVRKPVKAEMRSNFGPEPGVRNHGFDNLKANL